MKGICSCSTCEKVRKGGYVWPKEFNKYLKDNNITHIEPEPIDIIPQKMFIEIPENITPE